MTAPVVHGAVTALNGAHPAGSTGPAGGARGEVRPDLLGEDSDGRTTSPLSAAAVSAARRGGRAIGAQVTDGQWLTVARILTPTCAEVA